MSVSEVFNCDGMEYMKTMTLEEKSTLVMETIEELRNEVERNRLIALKNLDGWRKSDTKLDMAKEIIKKLLKFAEIDNREYEDAYKEAEQFIGSTLNSEGVIESEKHNTTIAEMLIAQANGKTIQVKMINGEWRDVFISRLDLKCDASFYRIKPEVENEPATEK